MTTYPDQDVIEQETALEVYQPQAPAPLNLLGSTDPEEALTRAEAVATALDKRVRKRKLYTKMGAKDHLHVEAWTMLGSLLGVFPVVVWTQAQTDDDGKITGYVARCEARTLSGITVGAAEAECTRRENMWSHNPVGKDGKKLKARDDHALRGMAQTRAISRAMRAPLGFVAELAGYAATPEAEMPQEAAQSSAEGISDAQHRKIGVLLKELEELSPTTDGQLSWVGQLREDFHVKSRTELTRAQASEAIEWLEKQIEAAKVPFG